MPDGVRQVRQYSLSSAVGADLRRITVKRVVESGAPEGEVSTLLHETVKTGDELTLSAPFGDVVLDDGDEPVLLVSAGIGNTPMVGILEQLTATGSTRPVTVLHADRSFDDHALRDRTLRLVQQLPDSSAEFWYEQPGADNPGTREGQLDLTGMELPRDARVYLCGPLAFMRTVRGQLIRTGIPGDRIQYEVFGPDLWLANATA
jgi:nitric oxide dioxygenase